jgi:hypothetical protein
VYNIDIQYFEVVYKCRREDGGKAGWGFRAGLRVTSVCILRLQKARNNENDLGSAYGVQSFVDVAVGTYDSSLTDVLQ